MNMWVKQKMVHMKEFLRGTSHTLVGLDQVSDRNRHYSTSLFMSQWKFFSCAGDLFVMHAQILIVLLLYCGCVITHV